MTRHDVLEVLRRPHRTEVRRDLRKPVESWFSRVADRYAIVLVDGRVFAVGSPLIE